MLVIQSQCDCPEDERDAPLPPGALDGFGYKKILHYSAKGDGHAGTRSARSRRPLLDAVQWMRNNQGVAKIGPGRAAVKAALEATLASGQRLISHQGYLDLCAEVERTGKGRVSDPALLLDYLHNIGTVFYREGLFADQIILDQAWALEAVYAVFDRASQSFKKIERNHGRFRRSELAEWVWQQYGVTEQELFLSFMQQCGICFTILEEDREKRVEAEYIAPDLLPERADAETEERLKLAWDEAKSDAEAVLTFALLPPGLMRGLIARIGNDAGLAAQYWRDGVCFYDEKTASRALIEQRWTDGWAGEVRIAIKRGQAGVLLQRLVELIEDDRISLGARPSGKTVTGIELEGGGTRCARRRKEPSSACSSGARAVDEALNITSPTPGAMKGTEGKEREALVDRLCSDAEARGRRIIRDKNAMKIGDRISISWTGSARGELHLYRAEREISAVALTALMNCTRFGAIAGRTKRSFSAASGSTHLTMPISGHPRERAKCAWYWREQHGDVKPVAHDLRNRDHARHRLMVKFAHHVCDILATIAHIVQPRSFDDLVKYGRA